MMSDCKTALILEPCPKKVVPKKKEKHWRRLWKKKKKTQKIVLVFSKCPFGILNISLLSFYLQYQSIYIFFVSLPLKPVRPVGACPLAVSSSLFHSLFCSPLILLTSKTIINNQSRLVCSIHLPGVRACVHWMVLSAAMCPCRILLQDMEVALTLWGGLCRLTKDTQRQRIKGMQGLIQRDIFL